MVNSDGPARGLGAYPGGIDSASEVTYSLECDVDCGWEGDVDAEVYGEMIVWTCPSCGYEHDEPSPYHQEEF